jgi:hypothetical protein
MKRYRATQDWEEYPQGAFVRYEDAEADHAALRGLVRELAYWVRLYSPPRKHRTRCDCRTCTALARADAALAGEPGERSSGAEVARLQREAFRRGHYFGTSWAGPPSEKQVEDESWRLYPDVPPAPKAVKP